MVCSPTGVKGGVRGWVTICARCKRVEVTARDWLAPETYLADHVKLRIQHAPCTRCASEPSAEPRGQEAAEPGTLALCPGCKRVDHGPHGWIALASFLRERIEARVVHGVCDPCLAQL